MTTYKVSWSNPHAGGTFDLVFATYAEADRFGRDWREAMIAADADPAEAEAAYDYEIEESEGE